MSLVTSKPHLSYVKYCSVSRNKTTLMGQYNFKAHSQNLLAHVPVSLRMHTWKIWTSFFTEILLHFKIVEQWSVWVFKISVHNYCRAQSCCLLFTPESQTNLTRDFWRFSDPNKAGPTWTWLLKGSSSQFFSVSPMTGILLVSKGVVG